MRGGNMTVSDPKSERKIQYTRRKELTPLDELRASLFELETLVGGMRYSTSEEALEIPVFMDQAANLLAAVSEKGADVRDEQTTFEEVGALLKKNAAEWVRYVGGADVIARERQQHAPASDAWWWHLDTYVARKRREGVRRSLLVGGGLLLILLLLWVGYQRFLAPDPATRASYSHRFNAETLADQGDFSAALAEVQKALTYRQDDYELLLMKGLFEALLDDPDAQESFEMAREKAPSEVRFLLDRGTGYLQYGRLEEALADAEAVVRQDPQAAFGYVLQGQVFERMGDYQKAYERYQQAVQVASETGDTSAEVIAKVNISQLLTRAPGFITPSPVASP